ncbi:MAG TPA: glycosyltransferase [Caulobacteraceae bacterium]|nr:glycosyltransferase [Caulobacteraceae bacterium]
MAYDVQQTFGRPGADTAEAPRTAFRAADRPAPHLIDTTMLFAPRSGGVKRYLTAKRAWIAQNRPGVRHTLLVPGSRAGDDEKGLVTVHAAKLPFGDGYRWPASIEKWAARLGELRPSVIEAGDPYTPGQAAQEAGQALGVPVVGFCHSDPASLAALHFGEWAKKPVEKRWARLFNRFDRVVAPSRFIADRLGEAGVDGVVCRPLGVDVETFHPSRGDRGWLLKKLGLPAEARVLMFAGRPAKEKNIDVLIEAVQRLGDPYVLVLVGAGAGLPPEDNVLAVPYERDPKGLAKMIASADAFVHANDREPFGLIVLEAMACGVPVVGVNAGGVAETVDEGVGQLSPSADPDVYAQAVEALFARDVEALGRAARIKVEALFSWDRVFTDLSALYGELTGEAAFHEAATALRS